eukprot:1185901-Prorocentrum_minimum.AAC.12
MQLPDLGIRHLCDTSYDDGTQESRQQGDRHGRRRIALPLYFLELLHPFLTVSPNHDVRFIKTQPSRTGCMLIEVNCNYRRFVSTETESSAAGACCDDAPQRVARPGARQVLGWEL